MERKTLSDGGWVDIREEITQRGRRGITVIGASLGPLIERLGEIDDKKPLSEQGFTEGQIDAVLRLQEASVVAFLAGWSRDEPLPTLATVGDLDATLFDELVALTSRKGAEAALALDTTPGDGTPDPKDRSGSSELSNGPSKDGSEPTRESIPMLPSGGEASATGG